MITGKSLSIEELREFGGIDGDYPDQMRALLKQQKTVWAQLAAGYESLNTVQIREFHFHNFSINVQFNPGRIISSSAKVDDRSIKERKCFLCLENLPAEQKGIRYGSDYLILCNPFPIFSEHFTIPHIRHIPQRIDDSFGTLLDLSKDIGKYYTVFYNGPKCGASAPDHLHFQAGNKGFMVLEDQFEILKKSNGKKIVDNNNIQVTAIDDSLRRFITVESPDKGFIENVFEIFYNIYTVQSGIDEEPMMNIISYFIPDTITWCVLLIPRSKHRPSFYFNENEDKILLSPAAVDFGGVLITPVEKDFLKLTKENIVQMFKEVSLEESIFKTITEELQQKLETT